VARQMASFSFGRFCFCRAFFTRRRFPSDGNRKLDGGTWDAKRVCAQLARDDRTLPAANRINRTWSRGSATLIYTAINVT